MKRRRLDDHDQRYDSLKEEGLLKRPMDTRIRIDTIKLRRVTRDALLALGCDLKFHEWGRPDVSGIAPRGEPCYQIIFPQGSKFLKTPGDRKRPPKQKRGQPRKYVRMPHQVLRGWVLVPSDDWKHGIIVVYAPHDSELEKPGCITAFNSAQRSATNKCGYNLGVAINKLDCYEPKGQVFNEPEGLHDKTFWEEV